MTEQQHKPVKRLIRLKEVIERTSLSKTSIYDLMKAGEFPKQVHLGSQSVAWVEDEIDQFINAVISKRESQGAAA